MTVSDLFCPLSDGLLVDVEKDGETTASGLALPATARDKQPCARGRVVARGPGFLEPTGLIRAFQVAIGDLVYYPRFCGHELELCGKKYRLVYEREACAVERTPENAALYEDATGTWTCTDHTADERPLPPEIMVGP